MDASFNSNHSFMSFSLGGKPLFFANTWNGQSFLFGRIFDNHETTDDEHTIACIVQSVLNHPFHHLHHRFCSSRWLTIVKGIHCDFKNQPHITVQTDDLRKHHINIKLAPVLLTNGQIERVWAFA